MTSARPDSSCAVQATKVPKPEPSACALPDTNAPSPAQLPCPGKAAADAGRPPATTAPTTTIDRFKRIGFLRVSGTKPVYQPAGAASTAGGSPERREGRPPVPCVRASAGRRTARRRPEGRVVLLGVARVASPRGGTLEARAYAYRSRIAFSRRRSFVFARRIARAMAGAAILAKPAASP